jgi:hypothetical protein
MSNTTLYDRTSYPSRILRDLAEGWLEEDELEAVASWVSASAPATVPEHLLDIGLKARVRPQAQVA